MKPEFSRQTVENKYKLYENSPVGTELFNEGKMDRETDDRRTDRHDTTKSLFAILRMHLNSSS